MSIRRFIIALGVIGLGSFGSALAADLPAKAPIYKAAPIAMYNWTGFYIGINGGGGWARSNHTDTLGVTTGNFNLSGGMAGGTVGYNWQSSNIVVGLEADWDWANIHGSTTTFCAVGCDTKITSFGTLRPRIGMTWDNFLFYVTGGLAWDTVKAGRPGFTSNNTRAGWTIGGGAEAFIMPKWSVKAEYLYASLNDTSYTVVIPVNVQQRNINMVRAGLNYHF
jgi:outer membrane immunogenic protein